MQRRRGAAEVVCRKARIRTRRRGGRSRIELVVSSAIGRCEMNVYKEYSVALFGGLLGDVFSYTDEQR